ncbi:hypothetical protein BCR32DRAFT_275474 [Anaeromyces robustus]|uniref:Uncharacterized protein n=1 Tax=Anaeromyces robustus TaxID=1754192 RepID=A0A1Y1XKS6_9FUNG|nr:hypothetical protein BCR32DRAFT_275474 [Anaeromyces robustus]|eukprot:ORX86367.1 hypothetical protein BCR32DRAFT_275474 [Anaeromyces robustus]
MSEENNHQTHKTINQNFGVEVIPVSEVHCDDGEDNISCTPYGSGEISNNSNASLSNTCDSSGSTLCVNHKANPLDDPIIQEMFKQRTVKMDKVEEERRIRMYTMMRYSKKYKHLQTERANIKWDKMRCNDEHEDTERSLKGMNGQPQIVPDSEENSIGNRRMQSQRSLNAKQISCNFGIDLHALDLIDMELNNYQSNSSDNSNDDISKTNSKSENKNDENEDKDNEANDNEEIYENNTTKKYFNNNETNLEDITKSNSKLSSSSSEYSNKEFIKSHYKVNSRLINCKKNSSVCRFDDNPVLINNFLYDSEIDEQDNSIKTRDDTLQFNDEDECDYNSGIDDYVNSNNDNENDNDNNNNSNNNNNNDNCNNVFQKFCNSETSKIQNKNKKKHKKIKLFKISHKPKGTIEINDANTLNKINFDKGSNDNNSYFDDDNSNTLINSILNIQSNSSINSNSIDDDLNINVTPKLNDKKKKHNGIIKFFMGIKHHHSKSNNINPENQDNNKQIIIDKHNETFKKTKSLRFSDSVNIIP